MNALPKDARGFVDSVVDYLKHGDTKRKTVPKVESLLTKISARAKRENEALVESAVGLSESEKDELSKVLEKLFGHPLTVVNAVKPELIGGLRVQVADWVVDMTIKTQLQTMSDYLTR
jgi:F0F1-type ATP synthase delta subunit